MSDLVFTPAQYLATISAVITKLLDNWGRLPSDVQQQLDLRRHRLGDELFGATSFQRASQLNQFLQWLETLSPVIALANAELAAGKGVLTRSVVQINDEQIRHLKLILEAAPIIATAIQASIELPFQIHIEFPPVVEQGANRPLIVYLAPDQRPLDQQVDSILVPFADLSKPVWLEVALTAPGFNEQTGDWTRAINVFSAEASFPAIFLLAAGLAQGEQRITVNFYQALGSTIRQTEIIVPRLETMRSAYALESKGLQARSIDFYTKIDFPGQINPQTEKPLIVQLTLQPPKTSAAEQKIGLHFADTRKPELIEVVVTALGFQEQTGHWRRLLTVYHHSDSQPAVFLLTAGQALGPQLITVDFYHHGRMVSSAAVTSEVTAQVNLAPTLLKLVREPGQVADLPPVPPAPADLALRVVFDRQTNELHFTLHSENVELGYQRQPMGSTPLHQDPRKFLQNIFKRLDQYARLPGDAPTVNAPTAEPSRHLRLVSDGQPTDSLPIHNTAIVEEMATIGQDLFAKVFPPALQREYWRLKTLREQGKLHSLLVISDEPWIPWELVKPYFFNPDNNQEYNDDYLGVAFQFVRWLAGRGPANQVALKAARLVLPDTNLSATVREQAFFTKLETRGVMIGQALRTRAEVLQAIKEGKIELLHLAAHADFSPENADESPIILQSHEKLLPSDLAGARAIGFRRIRPLVFLNACHTSQADFTLTGLGGWVDRMVGDIGVGVFIGSLWEVNDALAAEFAVQFYDNLLTGQTFGAAFHAARLAIRQQQPSNPTWLAYTLYADPNGKMNLG
ncbi:hypothetical protein BH10CHL1_BH10CHL1_38720 [soil metagenome]